MPLFDHFGAIAPFYDRVFGSSPQEDWKTILKIDKGMDVLDIGGGTGRLAQHLVHEQCTVVVADESLKMLEQAKRKPGITTAACHSECLPFAGKSYDRILMVDALHHVADQRSTARELVRILKPGGLLVIHEPDVRNYFVKLIALVEKVLLMRSRFLKVDRMEALFENLPVTIGVESRDGMVRLFVRRGLE